MDSNTHDKNTIDDAAAATYAMKIRFGVDGTVKFVSAFAQYSKKRYNAEVWYEAPGQDVYVAESAQHAVVEVIDKLRDKLVAAAHSCVA